MAKTAPGPAPTPKTLPTPAAPAPAAKVCPVILAAVILAGLVGIAGRLWLTSLAPRWAYNWDHFDNIQMGRTASQEGLFRAYEAKAPPSLPPGEALPPGRYVPDVRGQIWQEAYHDFVPFVRQAVREVNYPPLGLALYWAQSSLLEAVAPGQPVNTFTSRLVMSLASVLAELAAAVAAFLIVRRLVGTNAGLLAAAACWLLPPMAMDSSFWGQTDAWFIAPALFTIWLMIRGRWVGAGVLSAITLLLKPQGIFLGPVVLMAAILLPVEAPEPALPAILKRLALAAGSGLAAFFVLGLPWLVGCGTQWIQLAYLGNVGLYIETTMKAFNVWYLDALLHDMDLAEVLYVKTQVLGINKDTWGTLLVAASLIALAILYYKKFPRKGPLAVVLFSAVWLWSTFEWPTGVHERYIMYAIPMMVIAAFAMKRLWPAAVVLALVGSFELCHNVWLERHAGSRVYPPTVRSIYNSVREQSLQTGRTPPSRAEVVRYVQQGARQEREELAYLHARQKTQELEWFLTLACLAAYGWAFAAPFLNLGGAPPKGKPSTTDRPHLTDKAPPIQKRK